MFCFKSVHCTSMNKLLLSIFLLIVYSIILNQAQQESKNVYQSAWVTFINTNNILELTQVSYSILYY